MATPGSNGLTALGFTGHDGDEERGGVIVDAGLCLVSTQGAELKLEADTFPLVLQLRYEVMPSPLPEGSRIAVNVHRVPQ